MLKNNKKESKKVLVICDSTKLFEKVSFNSSGRLGLRNSIEEPTCTAGLLSLRGVLVPVRCPGGNPAGYLLVLLSQDSPKSCPAKAYIK